MPENNTGTVTFRFYEELNDLLTQRFRKRDFPFKLKGKRTVKDAIESLNIPHTEVDLILINGVSVGFDTILKQGDRISVYPEFESLNISGLQNLRPEPLREPAFICDVHLGRLAGKLRLLGFDTLYRNDYPDPEIIDIQEKQKRAILTCDRNLLKQNRVQRGYLIKTREVDQQTGEVLRRFDLTGRIAPFTRCPECNGLLHDTEKGEIIDRLQPDTARRHEHFRECEECGKIYWKGTHTDKIRGWIKNLLLINQ